MARLFGVELNDNKRVAYALTGIVGVGLNQARKIIVAINIDSNLKLKDLTNDELDRVRSYIEENLKVEGELRQEVNQNIKKLKDVRVYRGIRHKLGLPVRGQRTRRNCHTRKGHSMPVGGLKRVLTKT
ncbi:30S ribosomal protein S13 [Candidatus Dojkabacteria bacterium]|nr:30S ribosomal protein S13 [Candidatus Dojkabacteria bacterium]